MKKKILVTVKIYLPDKTEEFDVDFADVTAIHEIESSSPCIVIEQGKSVITYCGFPYIYKEKSLS